MADFGAFGEKSEAVPCLATYIISCLITIKKESDLHVDSFETVSDLLPSRFSYG